MGNGEHASQWQVVGRSVRGASHERNGTPNQDAIRWLPEAGAGSVLVLAVSDGHGSVRYSRSHIGARLAVETATQVVYDFLGSQSEVRNASLTKRTAEDWLPKALARGWLAAVSAHLTANPLTATELESLASRSGAVKAPASESAPSLSYGATLIAVAVTEAFVLYLQLGDGEIVTVSAEREVSQPLPRDARLFANETTSLCSEDAWRDFRVSFRSHTDDPPALILLATDGYPNSFRHESGFLKVGSDILELIRQEGLEKVKDNLEQWLRDSTEAGSGDDVTLGVLYLDRSPGFPSGQPASGGETVNQEVTMKDQQTLNPAHESDS